MEKQKQTRNRQRKPEWRIDGLNEELWRSNTAMVTWAQTAPEFRDILTVLVNGRANALAMQPGTSENYQLGLIRGYEVAVNLLASLARGIEAQPKPELVPTYPREEQSEFESATD